MSVKLTDDATAGGAAITTAAQSFRITVNPVDDMPSFTKGADQTVPEDAGAQTVANWATAIDDGDPEVVQALSFTVTNDNNALFAAQPSLASNGTLSYTPAANANGSATVTVTLTDDATAGGAAITTAAQTFRITVNPVALEFSFVDANNNKIFDAGDVKLMAGELADGFFDTRQKEGGYKSVIPGTGLVLATNRFSGGNLTYRADGRLVVDTNLTASDDIFLWSRQSSVQLDDPQLTAVDRIDIWAKTDISSTDDVLAPRGSILRGWRHHLAGHARVGRSRRGAVG